jgi:hypothetical protein
METATSFHKSDTALAQTATALHKARAALFATDSSAAGQLLAQAFLDRHSCRLDARQNMARRDKQHLEKHPTGSHRQLVP